MGRTKLIFFLVGLGLIAFGYYQLGVPPDTVLDKVLPQVRLGMFAVWGGALLMVIGLLRRS